jgi:hypothetical protein
MTVTIDVSPGELIDKITILELKSERIGDRDKLRHARHELGVLVAARDRGVAPSPALDAVTADLKAVNAALWNVEDELRGCERAGDFGPRFVELARSVYRLNDRRAALKLAINGLLDSAIVEVKSYAAY